MSKHTPEPYVIQGTPIVSKTGRQLLALRERVRELQETICDEFCSVSLTGYHHEVCERARRPLADEVAEATRGEP